MRRRFALALLIAGVVFGGCAGRPIASDDAGATGRAGTTGNAGATGAGGTTGNAGTTGDAGTTGAGGTTGDAGTMGAAGTTSGGGASASMGEARTMAVVGCSMVVNVQSGYQRVGGMRLWPPTAAYSYDCGQPCSGAKDWTKNNSTMWSAFDVAKSSFGAPTDVWIMFCKFAGNGATAEEVQQIIANTRVHAPDANIYVTGQPLYSPGWTCLTAGADEPELSDQRAQAAANDASLNVAYAGTFVLDAGADPRQVSDDTCHATAVGELSLGNQAVAKWGK